MHIHHAATAATCLMLRWLLMRARANGGADAVFCCDTYGLYASKEGRWSGVEAVQNRHMLSERVLLLDPFSLCQNIL